MLPGRNGFDVCRDLRQLGITTPILMLRRATLPPSSTVGSARFGSVRVDFRKAEIVKGDQAVSLSAKEFQLLRYFLDHRGERLSRERLLQEVWGYDPAISSRTVDVHVAWLRQKLEDDPKEAALDSDRARTGI